MPKTPARYVRAICLYIHVTVGQEKRTEQSGVINNVVCHFNPNHLNVCHWLGSLLHQYTVTVALYAKERLHAAYRRRTESMQPRSCFESYQWPLNCDFTISETTDDAMVKQKQFNQQSRIGGKR